MAAKRVGLGRGLGALIQEVPPVVTSSGGKAPQEQGGARVPIDKIARNPYQPRRVFAPEALEDLVHSIRSSGVLQPLLVRKAGEGYQLIAGERRLTAAGEVGLREVPVVIMEVSDQEALEFALVENLQREDLNLIEEAEGYKALCEKFDMTQEQVAERVGKGRASVTNALRILKLPPEVRGLISEGRLSAGHAKVLLGLEIAAEQKLLAQRVAHDELSVRALEKLVARTKRLPRKSVASKSDIPESHLQYLMDRLHQHLGTSVRITPSHTLPNGKKTRGRIEVDFHDNEELDRLLECIGLTDHF
ncbi:MAG: ParB/RepB/Spo0J family partition protein [Spartobacteria bacterium]|nr:ParB/RepB/Spo0J family partition protein [Spartobacteria bacterium]